MADDGGPSRSVGNFFGLIRQKEAPKRDEHAPIPVSDAKPPEYNPVFEGWYPSKIKFRGLYDLDGLYRFIANWLRQRRYIVYEGLYKSKPPELEFRIRAERKKSGFVMDAINIHYHSWGEYDVDTVVNGKRRKMANARMILTISGEIRAPYEDMFGSPQWTSNALERRLLNVFKRWFLKRELEAVYWDSLYYEIYKLHGAIKEFLNFEAKGNVY